MKKGRLGPALRNSKIRRLTLTNTRTIFDLTIDELPENVNIYFFNHKRFNGERLVLAIEYQDC